MKKYTNGPRKEMMYGGMSRRKPMMYGGKATTKKPRKWRSIWYVECKGGNRQQPETNASGSHSRGNKEKALDIPA